MILNPDKSIKPGKACTVAKASITVESLFKSLNWNFCNSAGGPPPGNVSGTMYYDIETGRTYAYTQGAINDGTKADGRGVGWLRVA